MAGAGIITWQTLFRPEFTAGGIDALTKGINSRVFDNFESYANDAAVQSIWTGTNITRTKSSIANAVHGNISMNVVVSGGAGNVLRAIDGADFGYPAPGDIRYFVFKGIITSGTDAIQVRFSDASDANLYREWTFTVSTDKTREYIIDFYSGGAGFQNTESFPGPTATGSTAWDQTLIDRVDFRGLANSSTFRFDDMRFYYEDSVLSKLNQILVIVDAL